MGCFREYLERREEQTLAPYATRSGRSRGRVHPEPEHDYRTRFQRDRDRIIHCKAFRRMEYKTQVFLNHEGDHYRTRLTHTLEVSQIARTIARALRLNEDLTEAIALAHDLGHTPFGHSGEDVLREAMARHGGFEHNWQGLRVVDILENQYPRFRGLNLTYEVRESIAKHTSKWDEPHIVDFEPGPPVLEAQVVEAADSIAYDNHDLDDGLSAGILNERDLEKVELWKGALEQLGQGRADTRGPQIVRYLINRFASDLIENARARLAESGIRSPEDVKRHEGNVVDFSDSFRKQKEELEAFLLETLYRDDHVVRETNRAKHFVEFIFNAYVCDARQLPPEYQQWAEQVGLHRAVCDYIAGMTDRYAREKYLQLSQKADSDRH